MERFSDQVEETRRRRRQENEVEIEQLGEATAAGRWSRSVEDHETRHVVVEDEVGVEDKGSRED